MGRVFLIQAGDEQAKHEWVDAIQRAIDKKRLEEQQRSNRKNPAAEPPKALEEEKVS